MANNKQILIDIQANTRDFVNQLQNVNSVLMGAATSFSSFSNKVESGMRDISQSTATTNRALSSIEKVLTALAADVKTLNTATGNSAKSMNNLGNAVGQVNQNVVPANKAVALFMKNMSPVQINKSVQAIEAMSSSFRKLGSILPPVSRAFQWNFAYDIVHMPGRAIGAAQRALDRTIKETSSLEGEIYDLEAFLGGPNGVELIDFAKSLGLTGTNEQLIDQGLQQLQNKILAVGQESTFTAMQIAQATTAAAKAGVSISEIAGPTGTALDAINLLAQNTGESLENSAENLSKLQNLFENSLSKTQKQFGQTADTGKQFQIIVDGLATADMSAAATADQLTQALFNVGGSAQNLNMSFFETVSLVASMVPAFESAASAGTSLKYMFSALSGGRSVKAKGALKELGLMDEYGQTVFFDKGGFKGLDFMTMQLRETLGDENMAVDVRNRLITDIFGQDALKAVSRLISMTDEQTREMLDMSATLRANAEQSVQAAKEVAAIKNEGLEYDVEVLSGTVDSLAKTLAMPLLKPMSNIIQTVTAMGNAAFDVITKAKTADEAIEEYLGSEVLQKSLIPNVEGILKMVVTYAQGLGVVLEEVTKQGWNMETLGKAVAALLGTPIDELAKRGVEITEFFSKTYQTISDIIAGIPSFLNTAGQYINYAFDKTIQAFTWIETHIDAIVEGVKLFAMTFVGIQILQVATNLMTLVQGLGSLYTAVGGLAGVGAAFKGFFTPIKEFFIKTFPMLLGGPRALFFSAAWRAAFVKDIAVLAARIVTILKGPWTPIVLAVTSFVGMFMQNTNGLRDFIMERFGHIGTYLVQTWEMISSAVIKAWNGTVQWFDNVGSMEFVNGFANMFKGIFQILEGAVVFLGGALKIIAGIFTLNFDLIKSGAGDMFNGVLTAFMGVMRAISGLFQGAVVGLTEIINKVLVALDMEAIQIDVKAVDRFLETSKDIHKDAYDLGANTAVEVNNGMINGLKSSEKDVLSGFKGLNEEIKQQIQDDYLISSPSLWFFDVGQMIGQGLVNGLVSYTAKVANAMETMTSPITDTPFSISTNAISALPPVSYSETVLPRPAEFVSSGNMIPAQLSGYVESYDVDTFTTARAGEYYSSGNAVPSQLSNYIQNYDKNTLVDALVGSQLFHKKFGNVSRGEISKMLSQGYVYEGEGISTQVAGSKNNRYTRDPVNTLLSKIGYTGDLNEYVKTKDYQMGLRRTRAGIGPTEQIEYPKPIFNNSGIPIFRVNKLEAYENTVANRELALQSKVESEKYWEDVAYKLQNQGISYFGKTGVTGVFEALTKEQADEMKNRDFYNIGDTKVATRFDSTLNKWTQQVVKSTKTTQAFRTNMEQAVKVQKIYDVGTGKMVDAVFGYKDVYRQVVDMGTAGAQYAIEQITKNAGEGGTVKPYKDVVDPYGVAEQLARSDATKDIEETPAKTVTTVVTTRRKLTPEEINARNPDQAFIPVSQIPQAATFDTISNLHQYSSPDYDVAKSAKAFQMTFGERGIAQRGLTNFFKQRPQALGALENIGNRAATFLSLKNGRLTPEDVVLYKKYLAQDKQDRKAYLDAAKVAQDEMAATEADATLTAEEKKTRNQTSMSKLNRLGSSLSGGHTDVYGLKVGSFADYASGAYNVPEAMKQYTDPLIGSINNAIFEAISTSEEFQSLEPGEQSRIIKAVQKMPLQAMAVVSDALQDGFIDSDELDLAYIYAGEDIATIRNMIAEGRAPNAAEKDLAYTPYIEGTATFARREDISGDIAEQLFMGWDNLVAVQFNGSGKDAWDSFSKGWGNSQTAAPLTLPDIMSADPATIERTLSENENTGKKVGENFLDGVGDGMGMSGNFKDLLLGMFGPEGSMVEWVKTVTETKSPSGMMRDEIGVPLIQGVIAGLEQELPNLQSAFWSILTTTEKVGNKVSTFPVFRRIGATAAKQFVNGFSGKNQKETLGIKVGNVLLEIVNTENPTEQTTMLLDKYFSFGGTLGDAFNDGFGYYVREYEAEKSAGITAHLGLAASFAAGVIKPQFQEVGKSAVDGIIMGINDESKYTALKTALEGLAQKMVADAQAAINSSSPSRLFAEKVGNPVVEGIAMGISDSGGAVKDALNDTLKRSAMYNSSISSAALNGMSNRAISSSVSNSYNYNLGVTTNQSPQVVKRSFAVMKSFKGDL